MVCKFSLFGHESVNSVFQQTLALLNEGGSLGFFGNLWSGYAIKLQGMVCLYDARIFLRSSPEAYLANDLNP